MSGVITPVNIIVEPFGKDAAALPQTDPGGVTLPIPVADQTAILVGAASFETGFPPATMSDPESAGGVPVFGQDMNGLLYMVTAYIAMLQAGQRCHYNVVAATAFGGYAVGASLDSVDQPGVVFINILDGNVGNPDITLDGWIAVTPTAVPVNQAIEAPVAPGTYHNVLVNPSTGFLDIDTTAGDITITGFDNGATDGQIMVVTCRGAGLLTLASLTGSAAANQIRLPADLSFTLNDGTALRYSAQVGKWTRM